MQHAFQRTPWPPDFPDVIVHGDVRVRNGHASYQAAKSGSAEAAVALVSDMLTLDGLEAMRKLLGGRNPLVVPVTAIEVSGYNAIPDAMAQLIAVRLCLTALSGVITQSNKVAHTKSDGWHRLVTPPGFGGGVVRGADYFVVDDHVGFGGTLANLRGHIAVGGGHVIGMATMTETREARKIAVRPETHFLLLEKHGTGLDTLWRSQFGYGLACLTNIEAGYLCRVESLDAIRNRMAEAAEQARRGGFSAVGKYSAK